MSGVLYVVSTPIGNLKDISLRAVDTLKNVDLIAVEDTRVSGRLFKEYDINNKKISLFEQNELNKTPEIINKLKSGDDVAIISDAGTPTISDPGYRLIRQAHVEKITVTSIPGPSSVINALSASGLPTDHFYFEGFLPRKKGRLTRFKFLASLPATIVVFESPLRLIKTLKDIEVSCKKFGDQIGLIVSFFQSNIEGEIVEQIQKSRNNQQGLIINAGGYTHTSVAIHDALKVLNIPIIELHITNIYNREEFRHKSLISKTANGIICGFGVEGYIMSLNAIKNLKR